MRDSERVKRVYAELRRTEGISASAADLIRLAHLLVQVFKSDFDDLREFGKPYEPKNFATQEVDLAMSDGGWKVLHFELDQQRESLEMEWGAHAYRHSRLQFFLGPAWQVKTPPG